MPNNQSKNDSIMLTGTETGPQSSPNTHNGMLAKQNQNDKSLTAEAIKVTARISVTAMMVSMALFPFEVLKHYIRKSSLNNLDFKSLLRNSFMTKTGRLSLLGAFMKSLKMSFVKNTITSNQDTSRHLVSNTSHIFNHPEEPISSSKNSLLTSGIVMTLGSAAIDTGLTNSIHVRKTFKLEQIPCEIKNMNDYFNIWQLGIGSRFTKAVFTVGSFLMLKPAIEKKLRNTFPTQDEKNIQVLSALLSGLIAGMGGNVFDVINWKQIHDHEHFKSPSMLKTLNKLVTQQGLRRTFFTGAMWPTLTTPIAFFAIDAAQKICNKHEVHLSQTFAGFFTRPTKQENREILKNNHEVSPSSKKNK